MDLIRRYLFFFICLIVLSRFTENRAVAHLLRPDTVAELPAKLPTVGRIRFSPGMHGGTFRETHQPAWNGDYTQRDFPVNSSHGFGRHGLFGQHFGDFGPIGQNFPSARSDDHSEEHSFPDFHSDDHRFSSLPTLGHGFGQHGDWMPDLDNSHDGNPVFGGLSAIGDKFHNHGLGSHGTGTEGLFGHGFRGFHWNGVGSSGDAYADRDIFKTGHGNGLWGHVFSHHFAFHHPSHLGFFQHHGFGQHGNYGSDHWQWGLFFRPFFGGRLFGRFLLWNWLLHLKHHHHHPDPPDPPDPVVLPAPSSLVLLLSLLPCLGFAYGWKRYTELRRPTGA